MSKAYEKMSKAVNPYGDGKACERIVEILKKKKTILKIMSSTDSRVKKSLLNARVNLIFYFFGIDIVFLFKKDFLRYIRSRIYWFYKYFAEFARIF